MRTDLHGDGKRNRPDGVTISRAPARTASTAFPCCAAAACAVSSGNPRLIVFVREDARGAALVVHNLVTQAQRLVPAAIPRVTAVRLPGGAGAIFHQGTPRVTACTVVLQ